jgi:hypothetical protein
MTNPETPSDDLGAGSPFEYKQDWQLTQDIHAKDFPKNLESWLKLHTVWGSHINQVVNAVVALYKGETPATEEPVGLVDVSLGEIDDSWTVDDPVVTKELSDTDEWLLLHCSEDQFTVMMLYSDGYLDRVFWEEELKGMPAACLLKVPVQKTVSKKGAPS